MTKPVILIPEPFPVKALEVIPDGYQIVEGDPTRRFEEDELIEALEGVTALAITSREQVTRRVIENAPSLKVIGKSGARPANVDVDVDAAAEQGIELVWSPTANCQSVAEMTLAMMLMLVKRVPEVTGILRDGKWRSMDVLGRELSTMTVGMVGLGNVGIAVARLLRAVGAEIIAFDPGVAPEKAAEHGVEWVELDDVFRRSDLVSLHCDSNEKTNGICGADAFSKMQDGAYLVNTARGPLVDMDALMAALDSGRVAAAALDVFPVEPLPPGNTVVSHPRIISTPHISAFTTESIHRETSWVLEDIVNVLEGRPPVHMGI